MKRLLRAGQILGILVALAILVATLRTALHDLAAAKGTFRVGRAALATLPLAGTFLYMVGAWRILLKELGQSVSPTRALQLWSVSNLGRYIPGKVWQIVGLVAFAKDVGLARGVAAAAGLIAIGLMVSTGAAIAFFFAPQTEGWIQTMVGLAALATLVPLVQPAWIHQVLRKLPRSWGLADTPPVRRGAVLRLLLLFLLGWCLHGLAFAYFASAFGPVDRVTGSRLVGSYPLAHVVGLIAVFAPGGIGVREGVLSWLLEASGAALPAHLVAVAARVWAIAAELLVLILAVASRLLERRERP